MFEGFASLIAFPGQRTVPKPSRTIRTTEFIQSLYKFLIEVTISQSTALRQFHHNHLA